MEFFRNIPPKKHNYKYAPNKWTTKQVLMHIIDTERVFSYRILVSIRKDEFTTFYNMDENIYASNVDVSSGTMESLIEEFLIVRKNSEILLENLREDQSKILRKVGNYSFSPRAMGYFLIGHIKHHINVINERYL